MKSSLSLAYDTGFEQRSRRIPVVYASLVFFFGLLFSSQAILSSSSLVRFRMSLLLGDNTQLSEIITLT